MNASKARENILKKIREALSTTTAIPFMNSEGVQAIYHQPDEELDVQFAEELTKLQGRFVFCINTQELSFQLGSLIMKNNWNKVFCVEENIVNQYITAISNRIVDSDLENCDVVITSCECLVARTGSMVLSASNVFGRTASVYAPIHICIAFTSQIKYDVKDALQYLAEKYGADIPSLITFATGPSRTADIEKTLIVGVHGPKEVYVFLVED